MKLVLVDVDGTLLHGANSEQRFVVHLLRRGLLGPRQFAATLYFATRWAPRYGRHVWKKNKAYLSGLPTARIAREAEHFVAGDLIPRVRSGLVQRIDEHRMAGETCILLTGTPSFLAAPLARRLKVRGHLATECSMTGDRFRAVPPRCHPFGIEKLEHARGVCGQLGARLEDCVAYADSRHDIPLLEAVGRAVAVSPDEHLLALAVRRGWEILTEAEYAGAELEPARPPGSH
jgi:phosphoserine phosphatase